MPDPKRVMEFEEIATHFGSPSESPDPVKRFGIVDKRRGTGQADASRRGSPIPA
jgi:hypothetical protein